MRLPGILPFLVWIQTCSYKAVGKKIEGYVQTSEMGWFGARKSCIEERGTDMFDPSETRHLEQSHYDNNTYYWVGGFETSQWIWTDNTPLFTSIGLCDVPTDLDDKDIEDIPYNSVLECYRKCNKYTIGLNGTNCYCLDEIDQSACSKESKNITMCFGNPVDHCGTESAMSVYNVDVPIKLDADDTDNICAYSKVQGIISSYIKVHPYDCNESLSSICVDDVNKTFKRCHNGLCVSTHEGPWISSNQSCSLAKFSFSEVDYFMELQYRPFKYWIGLHRTRLRHSINGKTVQLEFGNSDQDLLCLALMKTDGEWSEHWTPCNENHQSLCSSAGHSGYLVKTSYPPISSVSDTFHTTSETPSSTGEDNEIPGTSSQTTGESQIWEEACAKGTYGLNCNSSCSTGCSDTCDPANGSCRCKPGYSGHLCNNECSQAEGCTSLCGEGCKLGNCNTRDGTCGHPCKEGWKGTKCESRIIYCPAAVYNTTAGEFSLSRTAVGETFSTGTCHVDDKALVEVQCSPGRPREGNWSTFTTNKACDYSDLNHTDTSTKLRNALNGSKDGDIEKVIHLAANVTKNTTLNQLDLFLITDILEKAKNLSEVSSSVAEEVLTIYSAVINTSDSTLGDAQERARAPNRILRSVDEITGKIKPGPNGTARVSTDTFVSQVWDLTNPKVSENLPLGLSLSVSDDNQTSSTDSVFNQTLDHSKIDTAILLPSNFLKNIQNDSNGSDIRMSMNVYKDSLLFTKASVNDTKNQLNSKVVAAKIIVDGKEKTSLDGENVTMIFYSEKQDKGVVKECGYWNFTLIDWSTEGCNYSSGESGRDVCTCSHLTNFAVLTVHGGLGENSVHSLTLSVITILGLSLSIMGLSGTLLSFIVFKKLREKRPQQTLFNLALAELCAWLIFLVGITQTQSHAGCTLVAILLHYFLLASFLWMLAEAFLHYLLLVKVQAQGAFTDHYMLKTGIPAWGLPLLPVLIVLAVDPALYRGSDSHCWMSQSSALYAFALPVGLVILFNIIIYVLVVVRVVNMSRGRAQGTKRNKKRELLKIRVPVLCFILFGLSWIFGFLAVFEAKVVFQYLFCITSSTQGFLIFIFFTASNEEVRQLWHRLCCGKKQEHLVPDDRKDLSTSKVSTKTTDDIAETTTSI